VKYFSFLSLMACGSSSELTLDAPPTAVADGITTVTIRATAKFRGAAVSDGTAVNFTTDAGTFTDAQAMTGEADTAAGVAQIQLLSPAKAAAAHLTASFANANGETVTATATIAFGAAPPAYAGSIGWNCAAGAISARVSGISDASTDCTLSLKDPHGTPQPAGDVQFFAEAGTLTDAGVIGAARHATYDASVGDAPPVDVTPLHQEQDYTTPVAGQVRNPRDMVASLLAVVVAEEAFVDTNGNGVYDQDEPFTDEPEPFIDVDDDQKFTAGLDIFLPAFDVNGNGQWDSGNGQWDASTKVGRTAHVVWVGDAQLTAVNSPVSVGASPGSESFSLIDDYGNPPAGFGSNDAVTIALDDTTGLQVSGLGTFPLTSASPMIFSASGIFVDLQPGRRYDVSITDTRASPADAETLTLSADVAFTPAEGSDEKDLSSAIPVNISAKGP
jgi:hypothetical protein